MNEGRGGMNRREFIAAAVASLASLRAGGADAPRQTVHTVTGPIAPKDLGITLMHEHVLVDFIGADDIRPGRYDSEEVVQAALPRLQRIRELGCRSFVDCTPAYLGRDPRLLQRLARETGMRFITNTGYYGGGAAEKYVPSQARNWTPEQLAARWIAEWEKGIEDTGVRPGFVKTAVRSTPLSALDAKLVRAAALTHKATGLVVASHTGTGAAALEQLDIFKDEGAPAEAFIWVHAQNESDSALRYRVAERGAWVEIDGLRENNWESRVRMVEEMAARRLLERVLVSADSGWYHVGEPGGGDFQPYDLIFTKFMPEVRKRMGEKAVKQLLVENPAKALSGGWRQEAGGWRASASVSNPQPPASGLRSVSAWA